jgi:hypothetical protein
MNLYWIHHTNHSDIFSQGYIGVSKNAKLRFNQHHKRTQNKHLEYAINKYGWDNLIKEIVLISDDSYCLDIENKLRPTNNIGWNITLGGGLPPSTKGRKLGSPSDETRIKMSLVQRGKKKSEEAKQKISIAVNGYKHKEITCPHCKTSGGEPTIKRWHFKNCTGKKGIFRARVSYNNKRIHLGRFATQQEADQKCIDFYASVNKPLPKEFIRRKGIKT